MDFGSIEEILAYAKEKEKEAADFYAEVSEKAAFSSARDVLLEFAEEEKKHYKMLENFENDIDKLAEYEFKKVQDLKRSDYLVDLVYEPDMTYPDLLRLAMKREEQAFKFYEGLAGDTKSGEYERVFNILAQEEAKHKNILETLYDDLMAAQGD